MSEPAALGWVTDAPVRPAVSRSQRLLAAAVAVAVALAAAVVCQVSGVMWFGYALRLAVPIGLAFAWTPPQVAGRFWIGLFSTIILGIVSLTGIAIVEVFASAALHPSADRVGDAVAALGVAFLIGIVTIGLAAIVVTPVAVLAAVMLRAWAAVTERGRATK